MTILSWHLRTLRNNSLKCSRLKDPIVAPSPRKACDEFYSKSSAVLLRPSVALFEAMEHTMFRRSAGTEHWLSLIWLCRRRTRLPPILSQVWRLLCSKMGGGAGLCSQSPEENRQLSLSQLNDKDLLMKRIKDKWRIHCNICIVIGLFVSLARFARL